MKTGQVGPFGVRGRVKGADPGASGVGEKGIEPPTSRM